MNKQCVVPQAGHPSLINRIARAIGIRARGVKGVDRLLRLLHDPDGREQSWFETVERAEPDGPLYHLCSRWFTEWTVYFYGQQDPTLHRWITQNARRDWVTFDIGANFGYYSCLLAASCEAVHVFEPVPWLFERLESNLTLNDLRNAFVNRLALADRNGAGELHMPGGSSGNWGVSSLTHVPSAKYMTMEVPLATLDGYVDGLALDRLDFIKIDVEGAEHMVIRGAMRTLARFRPRIIFEYNKESAEDVVKMLKGLEYDFYDLRGNRLEQELPGHGSHDLLAVPLK